jgi:hypothetical protein
LKGSVAALRRIDRPRAARELPQKANGALPHGGFLRPRVAAPDDRPCSGFGTSASRSREHRLS